MTGCFLLFGLPVHHQSAVHHLYHNAYKGQHNRTVVATGYRVPSTAAQPHQQRSHFGTQRNFSARFSLVHPYHQHRWKKTKNKRKERKEKKKSFFVVSSVSFAAHLLPRYFPGFSVSKAVARSKSTGLKADLQQVYLSERDSETLIEFFEIVNSYQI